MSEIIRRIERETGVSNLAQILAEGIEPTDLQSSLLEVYRRLVKNRNPRAILSDYISNRFAHCAKCDPARLLEWDRVAFARLPKGFRAIELSPVCPLGTVSRISPISQDWTLTTIRNTEVVADATSVLALECALRRQHLTRSEPRNATPVQLACSHRVIRAQRYQNTKAPQHFRIFSLCSAGRDSGNLRFEQNALAEHIRFYLGSLKDFIGPEAALRVTVVDLSGDGRYAQVVSTLLEKVKDEFGNTNLGVETGQAIRTGYYGNLRFHIYATPANGHEVELVDGGDTDWTQKLLNNSKERLVTSGIGSERVCELTPQ